MTLQEKVQRLLDESVDRGTECGCQAALFINGELAVNACSGYTDWSGQQKIDENTVFPVFSSGKPIVSTILHRLVEKKLLSYDTPVGELWPEYACCGKEQTRVWHLLAYRAGMVSMPPIRGLEELADWDGMCSRVAASHPDYPPGTLQRYHPRTYGWLVGETACRAAGKKLPELLEDEIRRPAGMNHFFYGISAEASGNAASLVRAKDGTCCSEEYLLQMNHPAIRHCCEPSTCAMSNALSLAEHYNALLQGKLLDRATIQRATRLARADNDPIPQSVGRWQLFGLGYVLSGPLDNLGDIFGHGGVGGSEALADQRKCWALALTKNCFADTGLLAKFYDLLGFKNREWA